MFCKSWLFRWAWLSLAKEFSSLFRYKYSIVKQTDYEFEMRMSAESWSCELWDEKEKSQKQKDQILWFLFQFFFFLIDIFALCCGFRMVFLNFAETRTRSTTKSLDEWKTRVIFFCSTNEIRTAKIQTPIWHSASRRTRTRWAKCEKGELWPRGERWYFEQEMTSHYPHRKKKLLKLIQSTNFKFSIINLSLNHQKESWSIQQKIIKINFMNWRYLLVVWLLVFLIIYIAQVLKNVRLLSSSRCYCHFSPYRTRS